MKNIILAPFIASALLLFTPSAFAEFLQIFQCQLNDGKTYADAVEVSSSWLAAAKTGDGGENIEVYLHFPIAANVGDRNFVFVLVAADEKTWGTWYTWFGIDGYVSQTAEANDAWAEVAGCSSSALWNSQKIE